jgi:rSAM/selenodomain-associated transferase 1
MKTEALIIFVKNPVPGKIKTRLAKTIGEQAALSIYRQLLLHTYNTTYKSHADKFVFYSDFINEDDLWNASLFQKYLQKGNNLGERMMNAFDLVFEQGYKKAVIIGSDSIEIEFHHLQQAFDYLQNYNVVIGPAQDGGYYLMGMQKLYEQLFINKAWSTPLLLQQTLDDISNFHLSYHLLQVLSDVDEEKDLYLLHHRQ